jgi:hypothetical protein
MDVSDCPPEVVAVAKIWETACGDALEEAVEGAQGDILPIGRSAAGGAEAALGQPGEPLEITLPKQTSRLAPIAGF